jgi:predicted RNase H-like HicB family nuclease
MGTNILVYPVILSKDGDRYFVTVPDFTVNTEGKDIADAIAMARDAIGLNVLQLEDEGEAVPEPYSRSYQMQDDDILTLVDIDMTDYRNKYENRTVKKNCTIPYRLNADAEKAGINFSQLLQEALKRKLYG